MPTPDGETDDIGRHQYRHGESGKRPGNSQRRRSQRGWRKLPRVLTPCLPAPSSPRLRACHVSGIYMHVTARHARSFVTSWLHIADLMENDIAPPSALEKTTWITVRCAWTLSVFARGRQNTWRCMLFFVDRPHSFQAPGLFVGRHHFRGSAIARLCGGGRVHKVGEGRVLLVEQQRLPSLSGGGNLLRSQLSAAPSAGPFVMRVQTSV